MPYEEGAFLRMSPAEIIRRVAASDPSLAMVSGWTVEEQIKVGWLGNPIINLLYSLTSAGVWIARTKTDGSVIIDSDLRDYTNYTELETRSLMPPTITRIRPTTGTEAAMRVHGLMPVVLTSNAGGNLAADVDLTPAGVGGQYWIAYIRTIRCTDAALTPTLVLQDEDGTASLTGNLCPGTSSAYVPMTTLREIPIYTTVKNKKLIVDTTSSGLGNTKTWILVVEYWAET